MKSRFYAEALYRALENKSEKEAEGIFARFQAVLVKNGHQKLLKAIPKELKEIEEREKKEKQVILTVARKKDIPTGVSFYERYQKEGFLPKDATPKEVVDETIVGGFQLRTKNTLINGSYKQALVDLYKNITEPK